MFIFVKYLRQQYGLIKYCGRRHFPFDQSWGSINFGLFMRKMEENCCLISFLLVRRLFTRYINTLVKIPPGQISNDFLKSFLLMVNENIFFPNMRCFLNQAYFAWRTSHTSGGAKKCVCWGLISVWMQADSKRGSASLLYKLFSTTTTIFNRLADYHEVSMQKE